MVNSQGKVSALAFEWSGKIHPSDLWQEPQRRREGGGGKWRLSSLTHKLYSKKQFFYRSTKNVANLLDAQVVLIVQKWQGGAKEAKLLETKNFRPKPENSILRIATI